MTQINYRMKSLLHLKYNYLIQNKHYITKSCKSEELQKSIDKKTSMAYYQLYKLHTINLYNIYSPQLNQWQEEVNMDNEALRISNVYAAYTAGNSKNSNSLSTLSKMSKGETAGSSTSVNTIDTDKPKYMDKVIISKESLAALAKKQSIYTAINILS